jgi:glycosyltransferase involved in cell wall biosynthesis
MRIGVMLRHLDQHPGGVKVYTHRLLGALLNRQDEHEYVLMYRDRRLLGTFRGHDRVQEIAAPARSALMWDQVMVPLAVRRLGLDVLFNPKYSMSLAVSCPTVWVCHGLDWYVMPWGSRWIDRLSHKFLVPRYANKADGIVAVSETTRQQVLQYLRVPPERVHTVYHGIDNSYRTPIAPAALDAIRRKYQLPDRFFLYAGALYPPKNFSRLVRAYAKVGPSSGVPLVVAGGENRFLSEDEPGLPARLGIADWVKWPGWIGQDELPAFYAMATALLLPSLYEACPLPILEAMASGCPVVTANRYGTAEMAGHAALPVDPESEDSIAAAISRILTDGRLRETLVTRGRERARAFTWGRCADQTVAALEEAVLAPRKAAGVARHAKAAAQAA